MHLHYYNIQSKKKEMVYLLYFGLFIKYIDKLCRYIYNLVRYMLSRADERFGFMTPQQPIKLGANTDKVIVL